MSINPPRITAMEVFDIEPNLFNDLTIIISGSLIDMEVDGNQNNISS